MKVLVVTGSSGGHIFPAISFLDALCARHKDTEALLVLPETNAANQAEGLSYKVSYVPFASVRLRFDRKNILAFSSFLKGAWRSTGVLLRFKPDIVVGFGTSVCVPMVMLAWFFRIKTLVHEQNVIPGMANRLLAVFSDKIAVSFRETQDYFKDYRRRVVFTGNPIRKEMQKWDKQKSLDYFGLSYDKFTILVMGGSQGSHKINAEFAKFISRSHQQSRLQLIHLAGASDGAMLEAVYRDLRIPYRIFNFLQPMQYAYSCADLVVSRAGATTIAEITYFALPAILIPYPYAHKHQFSNARVLKEAGAAVIIDDADLDAGILRRTVEPLCSNPDKLNAMRENYRGFSRPSACELLVDAVMATQ